MCEKCDSDENVIGMEVRGVHDGVLYWVCQACMYAWTRDWTGYGRRAEIAARMVAEHNAGVKA